MLRPRSSLYFPTLAQSAPIHWLVFGSLIGSFALAADIDDGHLLPRVPAPGTDGHIVELPDAVPPLTTDVDQILVEALTGIVLFDELGELGAETESSGVNAERLELPNKDLLTQSLAKFIGKPVTLALLDDINALVVKFARSNDHPIIDSFAPEGQDISNGVIQFAVVAGRRGQIRVEGAQGNVADRIILQTSIAEGEVIAERSLRADLE